VQEARIVADVNRATRLCGRWWLQEVDVEGADVVRSGAWTSRGLERGDTFSSIPGAGWMVSARVQTSNGRRSRAPHRSLAPPSAAGQQRWGTAAPRPSGGLVFPLAFRALWR
jgi:hypothetical protein